jgi:putative restriction endonuclease
VVLPLDDHQVRAAAFDWLQRQVDVLGDVLPRTLLLHGFEIGDLRVSLISQQGIFKPRVLADFPLSITTSPKGPYDDHVGSDGRIRYRYRGTNPNHSDNRGLRAAMAAGIPLVYFHGIVPGQYMPVWPVFVVGDDPGALEFRIVVDDPTHAWDRMKKDESVGEEMAEGRRVYVTSIIRRRLHQQSFRERVLRAYRERCALCRLGHRQLLDAAHIIPDADPGGEPRVPNGLALCKLHHTAFDKFFLGIRPDHVVEIRKDVLKEKDGPMLIHGLQGLHGTRILVPGPSELRPDVGLLEQRYRKFLST